MILHRSLLLGASVLAIGLFSPGTMAQSNDETPQTQEDYSDDPSYEAARRLLEIFAGAADNRANENQRAKQGDSSTDPWPDGSTVESWDHHYFIFQGENYFPVIEAYVTPYVTLFSLEYGYTPVGEENKSCGAGDHQGDTSGALTETRAASESAVVGDAAGALADARRYGCPNTLGQLWGSGSQVMDQDHNPLAEQWFPDGTKAIVARGFPLHDEDRYEGNDPSDFVVVFSGGPDRLGDPAIHPLPVPKMIVVDYPVLRRESGEDDGLKQGDEDPQKPYIPGAPELPITVFGRPISASDAQGITDTPYQNPIDVISGRLKEAVVEIIDDRADGIEFLLVHRGDPNLSEQVAADRLRVIRETLNPYGPVKTVSFGQEMPICQTDDARCWSVNRSSILYVIDR